MEKVKRVRKGFKMTQEEYDGILQINKEGATPCMLIGEVDISESVQSKVNRYWKMLGERYGFNSETVEPSSLGHLYFDAEEI